MSAGQLTFDNLPEAAAAVPSRKPSRPPSSERPPKDPDWLDIRDCAQDLGVTMRVLYYRIEDGTLNAFKDRAIIRVHRDEWARYKRRHMTRPNREAENKATRKELLRRFEESLPAAWEEDKRRRVAARLFDEVQEVIAAGGEL